MSVRQVGPSQEHMFTVANKEQVEVDPLTQVAVGIIEEEHVEGNGEMPPPIQQNHQVVQEPLQQSVQETKTKERRLVFDTLKGVSREVISSYENMDNFKGRLEKEIRRANPELSKEAVKEFVGGLNLQGNPKDIDRNALKDALNNLGFSPEDAAKVVRRSCFVGKKHVASDMRDFKRELFKKVLQEREERKGVPLTPDEKRELARQIKGLDLGKKPARISTEVLKSKLFDSGLLSLKSAETISKKMCEHTKVDQLLLLKSDLKSTETFKKKLYHTVLKQRIKEGYRQPTKEEAEALKKEIDKLELPSNPAKISPKKLAKMLADNGIVRKSIAEDVAKGVCKEFQAGLKDVEGGAFKLATTAQQLNQLLGSEPKDKDLKKVNSQVISLLREAFESKAYQALKECEDNPTIRYLHQINLSMYTDVTLLDAYVSNDEGNPSLGDKLVQGHEERTLGESIQQVRDDAVQNRGLFSSHSCFKYIMNHFEQFWGAFTSQKIGSPLGDYDPHGSLGNNAGALYEETLDVDGTEGRSLDVRTPSPTIGGKISPEFRAALQAIENQRISESLGEEGYGRPNCWIYTNYQEMTNEWNGEHARSKAIMGLNEEFPLSFKGITLSKDSNYYKEGLGHGEGEKLWESIDHDTVFDSNSIPDFVEEMKQMFTNDSHFTLSNRTKDKGEKLYFPARTPKEIEEYKAELEKIAELTGDFLREVVKDNEFQGKDAWMVKAAAKEFAWAAVQKLVQAKELQKMKAQGITPSVITTSACKEDIDRGFSDHIKRMYMLGAGDESFLAKVVNLPALMARYRVILNDRIQPLIGVVTHVERDVAKEHLDRVTQGLGVSSTSAKILHQSEE